MAWKLSPLQHLTVVSVSFGGLFLTFALEILVLEGWPWYVHGGLSLGFFALAGTLTVIDRLHERRCKAAELAAPFMSIIREATEGLQAEQNKLGNIGADTRHDLAAMIREGEERERALIEKHKIRFVDDDD